MQLERRYVFRSATTMRNERKNAGAQDKLDNCVEIEEVLHSMKFNTLMMSWQGFNRLAIATELC